MTFIFFEFLSNREFIFSKIQAFSEALKKSNETNINIYSDEVKEDTESTLYLDRDGNIITRYSTNKYKLIKLNKVPFFLSRGFVVIEDGRFFKHNGFNFIRLSIGVFKNIITLGHAPGGSTISQQLAKILFTKQKRTIKRKAYEFYCTIELERRFNKNEILQIYLNSIYLGHGIYGIANASQFYFGKDASELSISEAALIIGMNRAPEIYSPIKSRENAQRIQKVVLNQFVKEGFISKAESKLEIDRFWRKFDQYGARGNQSFWQADINKSGYITEYIRQILEQEFTQEKITQGGLIVETTIDIRKQILAESIINSQLKYIKNKIVKRIDQYKIKDFEEENFNVLEASLTSIDYKNGEILVLVGGSGYSFNNQLNRAVYSFRPIGSSVKPFIYATALNEGKIGDDEINPFTKFKDEIVTYNILGKKYTPKNYHVNHKYGEMVTLYDALKRSLNTVSVKIFNEMDKNKVAEFIQKAAFLNTSKSKKRVPEVLSLALGTCELSTLELATAYSVFCRGGKSIYPYIIKKIYDKSGNVYYDYTREDNTFFKDLYPFENKESEELIKPEIAYEIVQMMKSVFEKDGTGYWPAYVTGFNIPAYAKSGTSEDFKDGWFAGFTNSEVSAVWIGFDNNKSMYVSGSETAGVIWCDYNDKISNQIEIPIEIPKNMKLIPICKETGLEATDNCPEVINFYFWKDGPLPEKCYIHSSDIDHEIKK
ncbi:MAG: transglycosylase domain-containing protein [Candidatus Lokiarchaeota archaeon]|nr:transglycosylase domain-containing protein [Candidatus Lokiarchaeota archaeon]